MEVDDDGADVTGLSPVDLVELFQAGGIGQLDGVELVQPHYGIHDAPPSFRVFLQRVAG